MSAGGAEFKTYGPLWDASNSTIYSQPKLYHYEAGTSNAKDIWSDEAKTTPLAQPYQAGTDGLFKFFADGDYKFVIKTSADVTIDTWDDVRITKDRALEGEWDYGTSTPAAVTGNAFQLFAEHEATTLDFEKLWINHGAGAGGVGPAFLKLLDWDGTSFIFDSLLVKAPIVNVVAYGAVGDGSTDDSTAIQSAADAIPADGGILWFPRGTYKMITDIDIADKPIRIMGDGMGISIIKWVSGTDYGIDYESTNIRDFLMVGNISLYTEVAGGGDAINANWSAAGANRPNCFIWNVDIAPTVAAAGTAYFTNGIVLSDAGNYEIYNAHLLGRTAAGETVHMTSGIHLTDDCVRGRISGCNFKNMTNGILVEGTCADTTIDHNTMKTITNGIKYNFAATKDGHKASNNNIDAFLHAISTTKVVDSIFDVNILTKDSASTQDFRGFIINANSNSISLLNNTVRGAGTSGSDVGIEIWGDDCLIEGNYVQDQDVGIKCGAGGDTNFIAVNRAEDNTADYEDAGAGNVWRYNYDAEAEATFTADDTTPSVKTTSGPYSWFLMTQTGATTITDFDDGVTGQFIQVLATDAHTTINNTGNINLKAGGGSETFSAGQWMQFLLSPDGEWYEVGRKG